MPPGDQAILAVIHDAVRAERSNLMTNAPTYEVILTDAPDTRAKTVIGEGLATYNGGHSGIDDRQDLAVLVKNPRSGEILGGILGRTSLGLLFIDLVFLPEALRGHGLGSRMLGMAEEEGRARGCISAVLYTISFQAPEFYAKHGWHEFGRVACHPLGTSRVFMTKALV
jgi:GNAT superfamily N-acetyltransferase